MGQLLRDLWRLISSHATSHVNRHTSHVTPGKLFDLLNNRKKLIAREDGNAKVNVDG